MEKAELTASKSGPVPRFSRVKPQPTPVYAEHPVHHRSRRIGRHLIRHGLQMGFTLHPGGRLVANDERDRLDRLCRCTMRPRVSADRLSLKAQGRIHYRLKTPYREGATPVVFEVSEFMGWWPPALLPNPRVNLTRYHGVLVGCSGKPADRETNQVELSLSCYSAFRGMRQPARPGQRPGCKYTLMQPSRFS